MKRTVAVLAAGALSIGLTTTAFAGGAPVRRVEAEPIAPVVRPAVMETSVETMSGTITAINTTEATFTLRTEAGPERTILVERPALNQLAVGDRVNVRIETQAPRR
jgi:hypothetical protein